MFLDRVWGGFLEDLGVICGGLLEAFYIVFNTVLDDLGEFCLGIFRVFV